jgi:flagellar secretion chaperone FliS
MYATQQQRTYLEEQILGASPVELTCILYRECLNSVRHASAALDKGDIVERNQHITRAVLIVNELVQSLDRNAAPQLAMELLRIYDYALSCLNEANAKQTAEPLRHVEAALRPVLEGWEQIAESSTSAPASDYKPISIAG